MSTSRADEEAVRPMGGLSDVGWLACERCGDWSIWENCDQTGEYSKAKAKKATYICKLCKHMEKTDKRLQKAEAEVANLKEKIKTLETTKAAQTKTFAEMVIKGIQDEKKINEGKLAQDLNKLKADIVDLVETKKTGGAAAGVGTGLSAPQLKQAADEIAEIEKRKLNVILSGLPERGNDINDLIEILNAQFTGNLPMEANQIVSAVRLGRESHNARPRLLCINLRAAATRSSLLHLRP